MKFAVERNSLSEAVTFAAKGRGSHSPVYDGILLQADSAGLRFTGSDGLTIFRSTVSGEYPSGQVLLPGVIASVVPALVGEEILFTLDEMIATITSGRSVFTFRCLPVEEYPVQVPNLPGCGRVWAGELAAALKRVLPAVDLAGARGVPALTGILVRQVKNRLEMLATDKYTMGWASCESRPEGIGMESSVIIPGHVAQKLAKLTGEVTLDWDENLFQARADGFLIASRAIQGTFPKWAYPKADVWLHTGPDLAPAVRRAAATGALAVTLETGDGLLISAAGSQGSFTERIKFEYDDPIRFAVGTQMLLDGLAGCGEMAEIGFTAPDKPVHLRDDNYVWSFQPRRES